jgi:hypothetical protein
MAPNHLSGGVVKKFRHRNGFFLPQDAPDEKEDQNHVSDFGEDRRVFFVFHRFLKFMKLLSQVIQKAGNGLFAIEGTTLLSPQVIDDFQKAQKGDAVCLSGGLGARGRKMGQEL